MVVWARCFLLFLLTVTKDGVGAADRYVRVNGCHCDMRAAQKFAWSVSDECDTLDRWFRQIHSNGRQD